MKIGIIGAGLSGLLAGRALADAGHHVRLFDKARGPSGRMSTRRHEPYHFDHGAQYFTVRTDSFQKEVDQWVELGVAAAWEPRLAELHAGRVVPHASTHARYVGTPRMSAIARHLATGQDLTLQSRVSEIKRQGDAYVLRTGDEELGRFDAVIITTPPEQAVPLLTLAPELMVTAAKVSSAPCFATMVAFDAPLDTGFDGAWVSDAPLSWVARNTSKPGRPEHEAWVLHASPAWTRVHRDDAPEVVGKALLRAFFDSAGVPPRAPAFIKTHRWMLALADEPLGDGALWDAERRIGVCGDWLHGCRVEGAARSGWTLADLIVGTA